MLPRIKKILYATDLSPNSEYVLRYAVNSAQHHGAQLIVLHVVEKLAPTVKALIGQHISDAKLKEIQQDKLGYAKERIQKRIQALCEKEMLRRDLETGSMIAAIEVVDGYPADVILRKAEQHDCDAIIMGTHGKGFLRHSYFGSTAKKVLRRVRRPVFIIPLPEGETDVTFHDE